MNLELLRSLRQLRVAPTSVGATILMHSLVEGVHVFAAHSASLQMRGHL